MRIALIAKPGHADSGVGRYTVALASALSDQGHQVTLVTPVVPFPQWVVRALRAWPGWDLEAFFHNYAVWARYPQADIYHITSQNLATLMLFCRPPGRTVITVHDILPHLLRDDGSVSNLNHLADRICNYLAMWGMQRVQTLLAVSQYTKDTLTQHFRIASERIVVTWEGVVTTGAIESPFL